MSINQARKQLSGVQETVETVQSKEAEPYSIIAKAPNHAMVLIGSNSTGLYKRVKNIKNVVFIIKLILSYLPVYLTWPYLQLPRQLSLENYPNLG